MPAATQPGSGGLNDQPREQRTRAQADDRTDARTDGRTDASPAWATYLARLRRERGLSASTAAARMGVTPQTWSGIEAGTRVRNGQRVPVIPKDDTLQRAAQALGLTPAERRRLFALAQPAHSNQQPWQTRLRQARAAASVSETAAARAAGVTLATYREWERQGSRAPRHDLLRNLLGHLGWTHPQIDAFMADVPPHTTPARAPQQPTNPVGDLPQWSQFITAKRVTLGLYFTQVDARLGQQSVVRRFELGGWPRSDGRCSVPSAQWLDRIAAALEMDPAETAQLHLLADQHRLHVAAAGTKPLLSELLVEARRAIDVTCRQADARTGLPTGTWSRLERGHASTLPGLDIPTLSRVIDTLPVRPLLATALLAATDALRAPSRPHRPADVPGPVSSAAEPADIPTKGTTRDTTHSASR